MTKFSKCLHVAVILFAFLTMRTVTSANEEPSIISYGFPLPWYTPSLATSLAYTIAVGPLLFDFITYLFICWGLSRLMDIRWTVPIVVGRVFLGLWWFVIGVSVVRLALIILLGDQFTAWTVDSYFNEDATHKRHIHLLWAR